MGYNILLPHYCLAGTPLDGPSKSFCNLLENSNWKAQGALLKIPKLLCYAKNCFVSFVRGPITSGNRLGGSLQKLAGGPCCVWRFARIKSPPSIKWVPAWTQATTRRIDNLSNSPLAAFLSSHTQDSGCNSNPQLSQHKVSQSAASHFCTTVRGLDQCTDMSCVVLT